MFWKYSRHKLQNVDPQTFLGIRLDEINEDLEVLMECNIIILSVELVPKNADRKVRTLNEKANMRLSNDGSGSDDNSYGDIEEYLVKREERRAGIKRKRQKNKHKSKRTHLNDDFRTLEAVESTGSDSSTDSETAFAKSKPNTWRSFLHQRIMLLGENDGNINDELLNASKGRDDQFEHQDDDSSDSTNFDVELYSSDTHLEDQIADEEISEGEYEWELTAENQESEPIEMKLENIKNAIPIAKVIREPLTYKYKTTAYLNLYANHFSWIKRIKTYAELYECPKCQKRHKMYSNFLRHSVACSTQKKYYFKKGSQSSPKTVFERLEEIGIFVPQNKRFYPYRLYLL